MLPKIVAIIGPTASGKTDLAIKIAKEFNGEIIATDSRTIYRKMNIGTAKPTRDAANEAAAKDITDLFSEKPYMVEGVPHWGIDIVNPDEDYSVADFKHYAEQKIDEVLERGSLPILAGGTGLYISAIVDNLTFTDTDRNEDLRRELDELSDADLKKRLEHLDAEAAKTVDFGNRRRVIRAIEIVEMTGKPLAEQQRMGSAKYDVLQIGIEVNREDLYERINDRVERMIADGLVDEVRELKREYGCEVNAMTGIGYRQICEFLDGKMKLQDAVELLKRDTRHYAKRQMTWFKRDNRIEWVKNTEEALKIIRGKFQS